MKGETGLLGLEGECYEGLNWIMRVRRRRSLREKLDNYGKKEKVMKGETGE